MNWKHATAAFLHPRVFSMLFLGFSAGIPILLIFSSLSLWLREAGVERSAVTYFSWAALGYSFKFVWAPLVDRLPLPFLTRFFGRRRAWLLVAQASIITAILWMASINPAGGEQQLTLMAMAAVLLGFSSATQDIVIDAYRIEAADADSQTVMSSTYIAGYRIGMLAAGAGALFLASYWGSDKGTYNYQAWSWAYTFMAATMLTGVITVLIIPEPARFKGMKDKLSTGYLAALIVLLFTANELAFSLSPSDNIYYLGFMWFVRLLMLGLAIWLILHKQSKPSANTLVEHSSADRYGFILLFVTVAYSVINLFLPFLTTKVVTNQPTLWSALIVTSIIIIGFYIRSRVNKETTPVATNANENPTSDYIRFLLLFVLAVGSFIAVFVLSQDIVASANDTLKAFFGNKPLASLLSESARLGFAIFSTYWIAKAAIAIGIVKRQMIQETYIDPLQDFFSRYGVNLALLLLLLVGLYRISDIVLGVISNVFYQDIGYSKPEIATVVKSFGLFMTIFGGFLGGLLSTRFGVIRILFVGALLSALTNLLFMLLATMGHNMPMLYLVISADNLSAGLASAAFIAFLSSLTNIKFTAVQYAIFSSLMTLLPKVIGGYSGSMVDEMGYQNFFLITALMGIPVLFLIVYAAKRFDMPSMPK